MTKQQEQNQRSQLSLSVSISHVSGPSVSRVSRLKWQNLVSPNTVNIITLLVHSLSLLAVNW